MATSYGGVQVSISILEARGGLHVEMEEWFGLHGCIPFALGLGWEVGEGVWAFL